MSSRVRNLVNLGLLGFALGVNVVAIHHSFRPCIPKISETYIEQGCVPTSKISFRREDYNHNGKYEPVMTLDKTDYLLRYNVRGEPELARFSVEPARIEPPRIVPLSNDALDNKVEEEK